MAAASREDAYLASLRHNARLFDSPSPRRAACDAAAAATEEYTSSLLLRSQARSLERQRLRLEMPVPSPRQRPGTAEAAERREVPTRTTPRTRRLWDDGASTAGSEGDKENDGAPPPSPFAYDLERDHTTTLVQRNGLASAASARGGVWDSAQVRREARRDVVKTDRTDVRELERCAREMKRRIAKYGIGRGEGAKGEEEATRRGTAGVDDDQDDRRDDYESTSVRSKSSKGGSGEDFRDAEERTTTMGSPDPDYGERRRGSTVLLRLDQARQIAASRATEDGDAQGTPRGTPRGEDYVSTFGKEADRHAEGADEDALRRAAGAAAREERLRRLLERNLQLKDKGTPPPPRDPSPAPSGAPVAAASGPAEDGEEDRLASWWARRKQEYGTRSYETSPAKPPLEELAGEPAADEAKVRGGDGEKAAGIGSAKGGSAGTFVTKGTPPRVPRAKLLTCDREESASSQRSMGHAPPSPERPGTPRRREALPPRPKERGTPRSELRSSARHPEGTCASSTQSTPSSVLGLSVAHPSAPGASAVLSVLSDDDPDDSRDGSSGRRCRSVASSTLAALLTRLEGAEAAFIHAQETGHVEEQAALAGLMARLGEAAVTMRRLERVADSP